MKNKWTKDKPKVAGVYKWRREGNYRRQIFTGIIMIDAQGYFYDLALGRLRRFHLKNSKNSKTEYLLLLGNHEPIVFRDEIIVIAMVKE